ncbi:MAG: sce7726 family protein [Candidatus Falkowbacteria bacterium]|nr:sce7726 family protein [Candidatus Falkowbacteria bacterium]
MAKNYNTLDYSVKLIADLKSVYPEEHFDNFSKHELHKLLNNILVQYYNGEEILKYKLAERHLKQRGVIGAFEMKVNNSRVDFLAVNGVSTSYEIKSELDNLSKLSKQMADYMLAFEYNYLVVDEKHISKAKDLLPSSFGLWCYKNGKYRTLKKAKLNKKIDPEMQLRLLTKKELITSYPEEQGRVKKILNSYRASTINDLFKETLKDRYRDRWKFLLSNKENIFPIDIQFFFNTNILPEGVYFG